MNNQLNQCPQLIQTNGKSFAEHINKINNDILPCPPLRQTSSNSLEEHIYRLNKKYDYHELVEEENNNEEEGWYNTFMSYFRLY